jgi:hypothetical protein
LNIEFELAEKALAEWSGNPDMIRKHAEEDVARMRALVSEGLRERSIDEQTHWISNPKSVASYLEVAQEEAIKGAAAFSSRLSQHKFLLQVAFFEGFLKDLHKGILTVRPELLRGDRSVPLGKLVTQGANAVIAEEIEREVQALDRLNVEKKADYFRDRLGIDWFDHGIVPIMDDVINARNEIMHENPDRTINYLEFAGLQTLTLALSLWCAIQASILYPGSCKVPIPADEETTQRVLKRRSATSSK